MNRVGLGFDLHRLVEGETLVLGGVTVDYHLGLEGHSDADVLLHALIDALLGASGKRDIGYYFPPTDQRYRGIASLLLLKEVRKILEQERWQLVNADLIVIAENPKLAPYIDKMRDNIASALSVARGQVAVKATTTEGLGVCGRGEGIAAQAVVLLEKSASAGTLGKEAE